MFFNGLPEMPIQNVTVKDVVITDAAEGAVISQADGVTLENIHIQAAKGATVELKSAKNIKVEGVFYKEIDAKGKSINKK
jgi:hypothetical protein